MKPSDLSVILCTVPDPEVGASIARRIVDEKLAACVSIVPGVRSIYSWKGKVEDGAEALLVVKARSDRFEVLRRRIAELHPYEVAEIVALPVEACHEPYLAWAMEVTD